MAKARKLPSGNWNCKAYSHSEPLYNLDGSPAMLPDGTQDTHRIYESFTAPTRKEAEFLAAEFQLNKKKILKKKVSNLNLSLTESIDKYVERCIRLNRSPATIKDYRCIQQNGFQDLMQIPLKDMDKDLLQEAIDMEAQRPCKRKKNVTLSTKRLHNEWGLITAVLNKYGNDDLQHILKELELPNVQNRVPELIPAEKLLPAIKGNDIELAVLLAAWLSFSMSEIRGLTKSKSINGDHIRIAEVVIVVDNQDIRKDIAKNEYRNRTHRIPPYIKDLIDKVPCDTLVPFTEAQLYHKWIKFLNEHRFHHMTFHDLRHVNASVMALLQIPTKYAQERGGWKTEATMKRVYTQTFPQARIEVDDTVDNFFDNIVNAASNMPWKKYRAWLILFDKEDSIKNQEEFLKFAEDNKIPV